jgi:methylated-DNA-[protein]-cysteine S-methyltransferase
MTIETARVASPIGDVVVAALDGRVVALGFEEYWPRLEDRLRRRFPQSELREGDAAAAAAVKLREYFAGDLAAIQSIAVDPGGTAFQGKVWAALRTIPTGQTRSYRDLAEAIGSPSAVRAVGLANGSNPVSIVVPCHRVIGADGSLTGYGGGIERKRWLLTHEGALLA